MKKTFWLYYGKKLITAVRCAADASDCQVIFHALNSHDACPCVSSLYPQYSPGTIRGLICNSTVTT